MNKAYTVPWFHADRAITLVSQIPAKRNIAESRMLHNVTSRGQDMAKEARAVVPRISIPDQRVCVAVERHASETVFLNVG